MLEGVVELLSGSVCAWKICISASGLGVGVGFVAEKTHWLGLSLSGE